MKILFVVHSLRMGGATKQLAMTANALIEFGHTVTIYTYSFNQKPAFSLKPEVNYIIENKIAHHTISEYIITPKRIRNIVQKTNADIVLGWRTNAGCLVALGCIGLNVKTVFCERSDPYLEDNFMLRIAKIVCNFNDYGIFQTKEARDFYKYLKKNSAIIPNPYNHNKQSLIIPFSKRSNKIAVIGRFELKQKRQDIAVNAFELFVKKHPEYTLSFFGDGKERKYIEQMVESKKMSNKVIFHGTVQNVKDLISDYKILLLCSDYEGIPNVILEAFDAGVPVVSTDCSPGGARMLISNNIEGIIAPRGDYIALADGMSKIVSDEKFAEYIIKNARNKLGSYTPNKIFSKWNNYLISL